MSRFDVGRLLVAALLVTALGAAADSPPDSAIVSFLNDHGQAPPAYVLARAAAHKVTILGEAHWLRQDANLVAGLVPALQKAAIDLALETLPASEQARIDDVIAAPEWKEREANAVLRSAQWPYREYRDILQAAWSANRKAGQRIAVVALGPPQNWREALLPLGQTYDSFMADLVAKHIEKTRRPIVVYCGMHHAFTRYYQAELSLSGRANAYMDRMGNILSRRFGERVFLIALHKPIWRGDPEKPTYDLPFAGRLDCAAAKSGRPVGFDVVGSPLADLSFAPDDYYALGHPGLRFVDYTDGYVWPGPLESFGPAAIIPLNEYAPDAAALAEVAHANPFTDDADVSPAKLAEIWTHQVEKNKDLLEARGWKHLAAWRSSCTAGMPAIPEPGFAAGWAKAGPLKTFTGQDLFNQIDGGAELFLEFGFARLRVQAYARGKAEMTLNAYEMESAASALGIYVMKMGKETPFPEIAARNSAEDVQMTIVKGRYFVQVDNLGDIPASRAEAATLANTFLAGVPEETAMTPLDLLPAEGKVKGSERLVRGPYGLQPYFTFGEGDILSQGGRIFGALADYRLRDGTSLTRLIIPYPDGEAAAAALVHLKANLDPYLKVTADRADGFEFVDFQAKSGSVRRSGSALDLRFKITK